MKKQWFNVLTLGAAAALGLSACGGGDGSPGRTSEQYQISLRAESTVLPDSRNAGVAGPYVTILYVEATEGGRPISGGDSVFECRLVDGLSIGALYYMDADDENTDDDDKQGDGDGSPKPHRSITLGANAGGDAFYFGATGKPGAATVTCAVTDPRDGRVYTASTEITVLEP